MAAKIKPLRAPAKKAHAPRRGHNVPSLQGDDRFEAEQALHHLRRAEEIRRDPKLMAKVTRHTQELVGVAKRAKGQPA